MAPIAAAKPFRVHITSFGVSPTHSGRRPTPTDLALQAFRQIKDNPSYLATKHLGGTTISQAPPNFSPTAPAPTASAPADPTSACARPIEITTECITVTYDYVNERVHALHGLAPAKADDPAYADVDLFLHVGVGRPGMVKLEKRGRRYGYIKTDAQENLAPVAGPEGHQRRGYVAPEWDGVADVGPDGEELWTNVNAGVVRDWVASKGVENIAESDDAGGCELLVATLRRADRRFFAGLYLCEFILFGSLAAAKRAAKGGKEIPVQFLHIPYVRWIREAERKLVPS